MHIPLRPKDSTIPKEHIIATIFLDPKQRNQRKAVRFPQLHRHAETCDNKNKSASNSTIMIMIMILVVFIHAISFFIYFINNNNSMQVHKPTLMLYRRLLKTMMVTFDGDYEMFHRTRLEARKQILENKNLTDPIQIQDKIFFGDGIRDFLEK